MTNRLLELERDLARQRMPAKSTPEPASLQRSLGRRRRASWRRPRAFNLPVDTTIPGPINVIAQPTGNTCWATVFTILYCWKEGQSMSIETALSAVGQRWVDMFRSDRGLSSEDKVDFVAAAGLVAEPPFNPTIEGWEQMLRDYGPIWVTTDEAPGLPWAIHARVIAGIRGDGTGAGTYLDIIDPAGGRRYQETFDQFWPKYEEEVVRTGHTRIQILHWPHDARFGTARALANGSAYRWRGGVPRSAAPWSAAAQSVYSVGLGDPGVAPGEAAVIRRLEAEGVPRAEIDAFLQQIRGGSAVQAAYAVRPMSGTQIQLPGAQILGARGRALVDAIPVSGLRLLVPAILALCDRYGVTVGIGPAVAGGLVAGGSLGAGLLLAPGNQIGVYGSVGGILGAIVSISASIQVTVVHGGPEVFGGTAMLAGITVDTAVGPGIGAHALFSNGQFIGVTGELGVSAGLSPFEAFAQYQYTATS